jgi:[acyl-carrier-protein] S-malonyltransferase
MIDIAYIFPGQGAQFVGMGKEIYNNCKVARAIFDKANEVLDFNITKLCFEGPESELNSTINCQPAIFTVSIACLEALKTHNKSKNLNPKLMAGLSLGEYSALVAANTFNFEDGLRLVRQRAEFMEQAANKNPGRMLAIIGLDKEKVKMICSSTGTQIANLNCPGQIVISGRDFAIEKALKLAKDEGAKKVVLLDVSGAFHCYLMKEAGEKLKELLRNFEIREPRPPIVSNVTARAQIIVEEIKINLIEQVSSPVLWEDSIRYISSFGIKEFLEIGPNRILKGIIRRIDPTLGVYNIEKPQDIEALPF